VAIFDLLLYIKARLLRFARNDNALGFFSSRIRTNLYFLQKCRQMLTLCF